MNYSKKGIIDKQQSMNSKTTKITKMFSVTLLKAILICLLAFAVIGLSFGIGIFKGILSSTPETDVFSIMPTGYATTVYDSDGQQLTKLVAADSNRTFVSMDKIPENLAHAFVAIEDERFYEHNGIDIRGLIRAVFTAVQTKFDVMQGASTITQQLLKNNVFTDWTSESNFGEKIKRKIQEQYLAIEISKSLSKDQILEYYMNSINLGQNTLGVQAASQRYFNKSCSDLTLSECAVIAAITQNPSKYNPISHPEDNAERRAKVLKNMLDQGYISKEEYDEAVSDDVYAKIQTVNKEVESTAVQSYYLDALVEQVHEDLMTKLGYNETQAYNILYSGGLSIYSAQDSSIQAICDTTFTNEENFPEDTKWYLNYALTIEKANGDMENHSTEMFRDYFKETNSKYNLIYSNQDDIYVDIELYKSAFLLEGDTVFAENISITPQPQVSITIQDQSTGYVVAMVGGRGTKAGSRTLNRAANTTRQPGSTFKVVSTYAPALDAAGLTLANVQNDAPFFYDDGRPVANWYGEKYRGLSSLRYGIQDSLNIVAVKTLTQITPQLGFDYLLNFGFTTLVESRVLPDGRILSDINQSLALGGITDGVTNMELNAAYATIANNGTYLEPKLYTKILDHDGNVIIDNTQANGTQVIKETTAFLLTSAMMDVVSKGTGASVNFPGMAIAGKTGTTSDYKDVWFAGFTPYYTATTWAGYDNNISMTNTAEKNLAKTLWKKIMQEIHTDLPEESFTVPAGIVTATVCSQSGKLPVPGLCDGSLVTEYFEEGTVPEATCDVHYYGNICQYTGFPATELCPFKVMGTMTLLPQEHPSLLKGSNAFQTVDPITGEVTITDPNTTGHQCPHNEAFFADPNYPAVIEQQRAEILNFIASQGATATPETVAP